MFAVKRFIQLSAAAAAALMMVSCATEVKKPTFADEGNMIPDNAVMAMKVNAQQLFDKVAGDPDSVMYDYVQEYKENLPVDAGSLGINLDVPVVVSCSADIQDVMRGHVSFEAYAVALLNDSSALVKTIDDLAGMLKLMGYNLVKEAVDANTYYSASFEEGMYVDVAVSPKALVIRYTYNENLAAASLKESMFKSFENGGPQQTDGLNEFYLTKSDIAMWMDAESMLDVVMPLIKTYEPTAAAQLQSYIPMYKGSSVVTELNFEDGKTLLCFKIFGSEQLKLYATKYNAVPTDRFLKNIPVTAVAAGNIAYKDFSGLVDELCTMSDEYAYAFEYLSEQFGVNEELLAGMPGTITFAVDGTEIDSREVPGFMLCAECESNVWEFVEQYIAPESELIEEDVYYVEEGGFFVFYDNGSINVCDSNMLQVAPFGNGFSFADTALGEKIENGGFVFNLAALPKHVLNNIAQEIDYYMTGEELLEFVSSVTVTTAQDFMSATFTVNMNDRNHNLLEKLAELVL